MADQKLKPNPLTMDGDAPMSGSAVVGPGLPEFDSDQSASGSARKDRASKATTGTLYGVSTLYSPRRPQTGRQRK